MTAEEFANVIRERLIRLDGTAIGYARRAKLPRDAIRSVFRGHEPRLGRASEICRALGLELYIGELRRASGSEFAPHKTQKPAPNPPPVWEISDAQLWDLIGAFADEWQAADAHGREMLETRFRAYFPELTGGRRLRVVRDEPPAK